MSWFTIVFITLFRLVPHVANFTPVGALGVLGPRVVSPKKAALSLVLGLLLSDAILALSFGYPWFSMVSLFVYAGFLLHVALGQVFKAYRGGSYLAATLGALGFFLISNLGVWLQGLLYPYTWAGLLQCYVMALPFLATMLLANLVWTAVLLGAHQAYQSYQAQRRHSKALAL